VFDGTIVESPVHSYNRPYDAPIAPSRTSVRPAARSERIRSPSGGADGRCDDRLRIRGSESPHVDRGEDGVDRTPRPGQDQSRLKHGTGSTSSQHSTPSPEKGTREPEFEGGDQRLHDPQVRYSQSSARRRVVGPRCRRCVLLVSQARTLRTDVHVAYRGTGPPRESRCRCPPRGLHDRAVPAGWRPVVRPKYLPWGGIGLALTWGALHYRRCSSAVDRGFRRYAIDCRSSRRSNASVFRSAMRTTPQLCHRLPRRRVTHRSSLPGSLARLRRLESPPCWPRSEGAPVVQPNETREPRSVLQSCRCLCEWAV